MAPWLRLGATIMPLCGGVGMVLQRAATHRGICDQVPFWHSIGSPTLFTCGQCAVCRVLMTQFHVYLPWGQHLFSIVS